VLYGHNVIRIIHLSVATTVHSLVRTWPLACEQNAATRTRDIRLVQHQAVGVVVLVGRLDHRAWVREAISFVRPSHHSTHIVQRSSSRILRSATVHAARRGRRRLYLAALPPPPVRCWIFPAL